MEAVNLVKGYGKVNQIPADDPTSYHHPDKLAATNRRKTAIISLLILFSLLSATTLAVFIYKLTNNHKSPGSESTSTSSQSLSTNRTESTRIVCAVTQYPDSCISAVSELPNLPPELGPELIFILYLQISLSQLKNVSSLPKTLISKSNEPHTSAALRDCASLFDDAVSQLNDSVKLMAESPEKKVLTESKIADVNSWISAAMTDQDTCLDGLEEMESTVLDEVRTKVQISKECMSNSLAILANIHSLLDKFGQTLH